MVPWLSDVQQCAPEAVSRGQRDGGTTTGVQGIVVVFVTFSNSHKLKIGD